MTSLTFILSQDQNEWQGTVEQKKETMAITPAPLAPIKALQQKKVDKPIPSTPINFVNIIKEKKSNPCIYCPKKFTKPSALKAHLYSHTGEKPNCCPYADCQRNFSLLSNLRRHIKIHTQAGKKKQQQQQCNNYHEPQRRRVPTLLPSPCTPTIKIFSGQSSSIRYNQQQPQIHHHYPSNQLQTPITKK